MDYLEFIYSRFDFPLMENLEMCNFMQTLIDKYFNLEQVQLFSQDQVSDDILKKQGYVPPQTEYEIEKTNTLGHDWIKNSEVNVLLKASVAAKNILKKKELEKHRMKVTGGKKPSIKPRQSFEDDKHQNISKKHNFSISTALTNRTDNQLTASIQKSGIHSSKVQNTDRTNSNIQILEGDELTTHNERLIPQLFKESKMEPSKQRVPSFGQISNSFVNGGGKSQTSRNHKYKIQSIKSGALTDRRGNSAGKIRLKSTSKRSDSSSKKKKGNVKGHQRSKSMGKFKLRNNSNQNSGRKSRKGKNMFRRKSVQKRSYKISTEKRKSSSNQTLGDIMQAKFNDKECKFL